MDAAGDETILLDATTSQRSSGRGGQLREAIRRSLRKRRKEGTIRAYFNSELTRISESDVEIRTPEGPITLANDFVFAMTGYQPDFGFLEKAGITFHDDEFKTPMIDENTLESNRSGLYLAGVIIGGYNTGKWFIENTRTHGEMIAAHIGGK